MNPLASRYLGLESGAPDHRVGFSADRDLRRHAPPRGRRCRGGGGGFTL